MGKTNKKQKVPHVREVSLMMQTMKALICDRIHWTEEQFNLFQFETGCAFLEEATHLTERDRQLLTHHSGMYWGWWRNQWFSRDVQAYDEILLTEAIYERLNAPENLLQNELLVKSFWSRLEVMLMDGESVLQAKIIENGNEPDRI